MIDRILKISSVMAAIAILLSAGIVMGVNAELTQTTKDVLVVNEASGELVTASAPRPEQAI